MIVHVTKQSGESLTDLIQRIETALRKRFRKADKDEPLYWYPREVFDDSVIVCRDEDNKLFKIPYTLEGDEGVNFGEPVEVEERYSEVRQSSVMVKQSLKDDDGCWKWRWQVVAWGLSKTRHVWRKDVFAQSLQMFPWENLGAFADHPSKTAMQELPERSIKDKVGWWVDFEITEQGLDATLHIKPSAEWLQKDLQAAYDAGNFNFIEASILVGYQSKQVTWTDNKIAEEATLVKPITIDLVTYGAADGRVKYALASMREGQEQTGDEPTMKFFLEMLFKANSLRFSVVRQSLVSQKVEGVTITSSEEQIAQSIAENEAVAQQAIGLMTETSQATPAAPAPGSGEIAWTQLPQSMRDMVVSQSLSGSDLPEAVQQSIRTRLGANPTLEAVDDAIESARTYLGVMAQAGFDNGRPEIVADSFDKIAMSIGKAFGLSREDYNGITSRSEKLLRQSTGNTLAQAPQDLWNGQDSLLSIKRLYVEMTGDEGFEGVSRKPRRLTKQATWVTTDFSELIAAVTGKRLLRDYRSVPQTWRRIAMTKPVGDFKTQRAVLLGYFGDLSAVSQDAAYVEVSALSDTEETYAISKRGRLVSLSLETVANDDLSGFVRVTGRLGKAAARTLEKFAWNTCLMSNPTMAADTVAVFHASHSNLITTALGTAGLKSAIATLQNQTEPGSNEKIGLDTKSLTLAVPTDISLDAQTLTDFNNTAPGETEGLAQTIRRLGITPVTIPWFSDANDWLLVADVMDVDIVELGFFNGNEEPEFFTQADPTQGDYFAKDTVAKYKVRHIYGGAPVDFRGVVKSAVV